MKNYEDLIPFAQTDAEREAINLLLEHGSQRAAAAAVGRTRDWLRDRLRRVQRRAAGATVPSHEDEEPTVKGSVEARQARPVPGKGRYRRYILTAQQNNTPIHEQFWANLQAFARDIGAKIMVSRFSYDVTAYGAKSTKVGKSKAFDGELWYDPTCQKHWCDRPEDGSSRWQLAPDLLWCAELNISPSAVRPLSGLETYGAGSSCIFPHSTVALQGLPVFGEKLPRFSYTTGAVTLRNYIAKKAGIKAEFHHTYGALFVEVDTKTGDWWVRQLNASEDGSFYDLDKHVTGGVVYAGERVEAIQWGDVHASEMDDDVVAVNWGDQHTGEGAIDMLRPKYQFFHDTMSFRSASHHEKSFGARYRKFLEGGDRSGVEAETYTTYRLLQLARRPWCHSMVVNSNHDRHMDRWLDEADFKADPENAEFYLEASLARVQTWKRGDAWDPLKWSMERCHGGELPGTTFLPKDADFVICSEHPVQCGQHGDAGVNGARGTTASYAKVTERINKGHAHTAEIRNGVVSAGVCMRRAGYCHGASSWSISHIVTYANGKRAILTQRGGKLWL